MRHLIAISVLALTSCGIADSEPSSDVSGTYRGLSVLDPGAAVSNADVVADTATYTLRIRDDNGFVHGVWTIEGDTAQPTDPWEAIITGDHTDGRVVLEYFSPTKGQCHLAGGVTDDYYTPEHRCEDGWSVVDTLQLTKLDAESGACPPGSPVWMGLSVCGEGDREGYDRDAFGTGYRSLEDEIVDSLPQVRDSVYTPYTCKLFAIKEDGTADTDIDHIVALAEAYDSGLDSASFRDFGKDLDNLTIADPTVNRHRKSDNDAAEWSPTHNRGWYAAKIVAVKQKYGMSVNPAERDSLASMLSADTSRVVICSQ